MDFKLPTETVELPSKGLLYPEGHPLAEGKVEIKYMTAREEDILTNPNFIRQGVVIDKLLQSLIVTKVDYDDLLIGDKDAIMMAARILGYGKDYTFRYKGEEITCDLSYIKEKYLDETKLLEKGKNEFSYTLPNTKNVLTFKLLNQRDDKAIDKEVEGLKKINKNNSYEYTTRLKHIILSVNGDYEKKTIREFVETAFLARDARAFREYYAKLAPGLDTKITHVFADGEEGEVEIQFGTTFFWPGS